MHNLHKFLLRSFCNSYRSRILRLRLHEVFDRDAREAKSILQVQIFANQFRKEARVSC